MAAQGYQESQLDQTRRSALGAVGVMQLMPVEQDAVRVRFLQCGSRTHPRVAQGRRSLEDATAGAAKKRGFAG
jgi:hypothetical protein